MTDIERAEKLWIAALADGTPDAALLILAALTAVRREQIERDAGMLENFPALTKTFAQAAAALRAQLEEKG